MRFLWRNREAFSPSFMVSTLEQFEVSVIVPARNEEASLGACLRSLVRQCGDASKDLSHPFPKDGKGWGTQESSDMGRTELRGQKMAEWGTRQNWLEIVVVDDHSTDRTREVAQGFAVRVLDAEPLPEGWSGKCNACWSGANAATGKWLLFTDADTVHQGDSIAQGLAEAERTGAAMVSYSPKQEVHSLAERALMPVIFAELATRFRPQDVSDPNSPAAAANGQYLLIRREAYEAVGGHAAVALDILEDVELARRVKQAGYRLQFRLSDAVSTRMYRSFGAMWEGWTKNLALLFRRPMWLALRRLLEFLVILVFALAALNAAFDEHDVLEALWPAAVAALFLIFFYRRIRRAHFDWLSNLLALWGLPLFSLLLVNSYISHKRGKVSWKGRAYAGMR